MLLTARRKRKFESMWQPFSCSLLLLYRFLFHSESLSVLTHDTLKTDEEQSPLFLIELNKHNQVVSWCLLHAVLEFHSIW